MPKKRAVKRAARSVGPDQVVYPDGMSGAEFHSRNRSRLVRSMDPRGEVVVPPRKPRAKRAYPKTAEPVRVLMDELKGVAVPGADGVLVATGWDGTVGERYLPYDTGTTIRVDRIVDMGSDASPRAPRLAGVSGALLGHHIELKFLNRDNVSLRIEKERGKAIRVYACSDGYEDRLIFTWSVDSDPPVVADDWDDEVE